jgi:hypothetical protein
MKCQEKKIKKKLYYFFNISCTEDQKRIFCSKIVKKLSKGCQKVVKNCQKVAKNCQKLPKKVVKKLLKKLSKNGKIEKV